MAALHVSPLALSGFTSVAARSASNGAVLRATGLRVSSVSVCKGLAKRGGSRTLRDSRTVACKAQEVVAGVAGSVSDADFKQVVLESDLPVLVDFWAPWCGPCRMIAPLIDELAKQYAGKLKCVKVNTDESPSVPTEYGIRSIPTVLIFKGGKKVDTVIGAVPKATLVSTVEKYL